MSTSINIGPCGCCGGVSCCIAAGSLDACPEEVTSPPCAIAQILYDTVFLSIPGVCGTPFNGNYPVTGTLTSGQVNYTFRFPNNVDGVGFDSVLSLLSSCVCPPDYCIQVGQLGIYVGVTVFCEGTNFIGGTFIVTGVSKTCSPDTMTLQFDLVFSECDPTWIPGCTNRTVPGCTVTFYHS